MFFTKKNMVQKKRPEASLFGRFSEEEHVQAEKKKPKIGQEELGVDPAAQTPKAPALHIDPSDHSDNNKKEESPQKCREDKRS
jgi:hypothetical protein